MPLLYFLYIPALAGALCLIIPAKWRPLREVVSLAGALLFLYLGFQAYSVADQTLRIPWFRIGAMDFSLILRLTGFSRFILQFLGLFSFLGVLFSWYYYRHKSVSVLYYPFICWTLAGAAIIVLADSFFILLLGWELTTLMLFFLIAMGKGKPAAMAAGKTFAILGFSDVALIFGIIALPIVYGTWQISALHIQVGSSISLIIYLLFLGAALAKAGAMPFHSWIPDAASHGPLPAVALLPASFDKLLGIYLLARLNLDVFNLSQPIFTILLIIGAVTLLFANFMALIQTNVRKFLGFATISQVGLMLIGFGSGTVIGIMGGLFHMLNHAIYKTLLFFGVGVVERETGTSEMSELGGLARKMPYTFALVTIGCFAASGIPPFNAFVSKWMIYDSTLQAGLPVMLIIAMFGSALTLASFLKMWYTVFMGPPNPNLKSHIRDGSFISHFAMLIPALLCVLFGIFARLPIQKYIAPLVGSPSGFSSQTMSLWQAFYNPTLAAAFLLLGLVLGGLFFLITRRPVRKVDTLFIGGETFQADRHRSHGDDMFESITRLKFLGGALKEGNKGIFDLYNISGNLGLILVNALKSLHDGVLSTYLSWCVIGLGIICFVLLVL